MKLKRLFLVASLFTAVTFTACDDDDNDTEEITNTQDQTFVIQAAMSNRAEVDMGTLASTKAVNPSIKTFAQMMVTEHTQAQTDLEDVADDVNVNYGDTLSTEDKALKATLSRLSGEAFDKAYIQSQVTAHQKTLANFDAELASGSNAKVRSYATEYRPHIQMHLDSATAINTRIR